MGMKAIADAVFARMLVRDGLVGSRFLIATGKRLQFYAADSGKLRTVAPRCVRSR